MTFHRSCTHFEWQSWRHIPGTTWEPKTNPLPEPNLCNCISETHLAPSPAEHLQSPPRKASAPYLRSLISIFLALSFLMKRHRHPQASSLLRNCWPQPAFTAALTREEICDSGRRAARCSSPGTRAGSRAPGWAGLCTNTSQRIVRLPEIITATGTQLWAHLFKGTHGRCTAALNAQGRDANNPAEQTQAESTALHHGTLGKSRINIICVPETGMESSRQIFKVTVAQLPSWAVKLSSKCHSHQSASVQKASVTQPGSLLCEPQNPSSFQRQRLLISTLKGPYKLGHWHCCQCVKNVSK